MDDFRVPLRCRPPQIGDGEIAFAFPKKLDDKDDELALGLRFICNRRLFGACYGGIMANYFESMREGSGVLIGAFIPSTRIMPTMVFPGDIDLLVIPYERDELVISETLAIELKVVRAKFSKQGRSPNEYGFSQAKGMLAQGFPYSAVIHLITSDDSPTNSWREVFVTEIIDVNTGAVKEPWPISADMLPGDLITRCFGRLRANCDEDQLGLAAVYVRGNGIWFPTTRVARRNTLTSFSTFEAIAAFYERHYRRFLDTPKY